MSRLVSNESSLTGPYEVIDLTVEDCDTVADRAQLLPAVIDVEFLPNGDVEYIYDKGATRKTGPAPKLTTAPTLKRTRKTGPAPGPKKPTRHSGITRTSFVNPKISYQYLFKKPFRLASKYFTGKRQPLQVAPLSNKKTKTSISK